MLDADTRLAAHRSPTFRACAGSGVHAAAAGICGSRWIGRSILRSWNERSTLQ